MADAVSSELLTLQQAVIGRYSLERELGRGGMGVVFLARDIALDRLVAIKLLLPSLAAKPGTRERFVREAQLAARLSHPNITPIFAVEQQGDLVYFVMAFVDGETLGEKIRARGALTPHETARMVQETAWALGYAHGRGLVHRDVKPDNIMLERGTGRALVMDFGIAAQITDELGHEILGTAQYMSPEQASGDPVDGRSDIYSLGIVAFLALTGRLPFSADDAAGLLAMHITREPPPVASVAPGMPRRLAQAVDRCLAKKPEERFPDGEALAESVAQSIEVKRELPVAVRMWLTKGQESRMGYIVWYIVMAPLSARLIFEVGGALLVTGALGLYALGPAAIDFGHRLHRLRKLLASGYGIEDARLAVQDFVIRRREEVIYEYGVEPPGWAKLVRKLFLLSGATVAACTVGLMAQVFPASNVAGLLLAGSCALTLGTAVLQVLQPGKKITKDLGAELRLKFWNSKFARWFEKLARFGLKKRAVPAELTYRPTELAIGMAADALFESLPKDQRKELKELPTLLDRLQLDAQRMRLIVDDLNGALAGIGEQSAAAQSSALRGEAGSALVATREKLEHDLSLRRDEASVKLGAAVSALENIRLNLLRLKAGTGTMAELTADLGAARDAQQQLERAAAAREEVETLLRGARSLTGQLSPVTPHG